MESMSARAFACSSQRYPKTGPRNDCTSVTAPPSKTTTTTAFAPQRIRLEDVIPIPRYSNRDDILRSREIHAGRRPPLPDDNQ